MGTFPSAPQSASPCEPPCLQNVLLKTCKWKYVGFFVTYIQYSITVDFGLNISYHDFNKEFDPKNWLCNKTQFNG